MAGQLPRPWFRLGSLTRPTTVATTAPVTDQQRPVPARIRPPIIRPAPLTEPAEPTTPQRSKSPPPTSPVKKAASTPQLPLAGSFTPTVKKAASPPQLPFPGSPTPTMKKAASPPQLPLPGSLTPTVKKAASSPQLPLPGSLTPPVKKEASPPATALTRPALPSPSNGQSGGIATASLPAKPISPKGRSSSVVGSPRNNDLFNKDNSKQPSPISSPSIPKSIPAVPTPYQSPKPKAAASPLSPLILPPSQLLSVDEPKHETIPQEVERKTVVFQKVMDKASQAEHHITDYHTHAAGFGQNGKQEPKKSDEGQSKDKVIGAKKALGPSNDKDANTSTRVITMAGENNGASMEIFLSDKNSNIRHHQNEDTSNNNPKGNTSKKKTIGTRNGLPLKAFFNSNVQGINNSILMDSKFSHHDPGIHLIFPPMPPSAHDEDDQEHQ